MRAVDLFGCRSFRMCRLTIWNELLQDLRNTDTREQFKRSLKSWLFGYAYTAGGASDRLWLKAHRINGLTYLLTYLLIFNQDNRPLLGVPSVVFTS